MKKNTKVKSKKQKNSDKKLKDSILALNDEIEDLKNKNIRLLAEFDNYKKRNIEERRQILQYDGKDFIVGILPILDDLDRTLNLKELKKNKNIFNGIKMIREKINKIFEEKGVKSYDAINESFDTNLHEALMMKKSKKKSGIVLEEFEKGYTYHEKVIRHSKVIVSE